MMMVTQELARFLQIISSHAARKIEAQREGTGQE